MRIGIAGTPELRNFKKVATKVLQELEDEDLVFEEHTAEALGRKGVPMKKLKADVLVSIGGDGTILRNIQATSIPILGVNAGVLGFLTEVQPDEIRESMAQFLRGDYKIERRLRLKIMVNGKRMKDATNEAVVHTAHVAKMRHFVLSVDHKPATDMRADGIIVATPTGTTCYAMSVGSSIVDPRVEALVIAPIAPFRLSSRPLVVPAKSSVSVTIHDPKECVMVVDGQEEIFLDGTEEIVFSASEKKAKLVILKSEFYKNLEEKLMASSPMIGHRH
ncbi:MAG: kinase [Candidatus Thermoplasmatota archaeon]|nr:kinase [Candidatus Thermoplasmatota archaeon]